MRLAIPTVFFVLAGYFVLAGKDVDLPIPQGSGLRRADVVHGPPRSAIGEPPTMQNGSFRQQCSECHSLFESNEKPSEPLMQHTNIVLRHGMNDRCYHCHSRGDRDRLILRDGTEFGFDEPQRLCAQCHGTTFRDWSLGIHGRTDGYWDRSRGEPRRLLCTECHDPHSPAYPPYVPLPGPNTLRMGPQESERVPHGGIANPLEKWKAHHGERAQASEHGDPR